MNTAERLQDYYPGFSQDVIDEVAAFAEFQQGFEDYQDFFGAVGIPEVETITFDGSTGVTVVDVRPKEHDSKKALVMHLPMANPLDTNQLFQVATIAGTNPNTRIIAFGNPSSGKYKGQVLSRDDRRSVAGKHLTPLVADGVRYIENEGIETTDEAGYSYGALKVLAAAYAANYSMKHVVAIEPVTGKRNIAKLGIDFASTNKALKQYTEAPQLPIYRQARDDAVSDTEYFKGLLRPTNIAVARALGKSGLHVNMMDALFFNDESDITVAWGSESELADDNYLQVLVRDFQNTSDYNRVHALRLEGQKHALANDVHLHAAIILHATIDS